MRFALDVGIIGCGTAGSAAAIFLARAGHRVTVYERVPQPGPVGAGIVLQPTGQAVLARLGLLDPVMERGARLDGLLCTNDRGLRIVDIAYDVLGPDLFGLGLHRGVLFRTLFEAVEREDVTLRCGVPIEDLARARGAGDRLWVVEPDRTRHGPHDLIVVADGARSRLRDDTSLAESVAPYPWGALWFVGKDPERRFHSRLHQVVRGTERMMGLLPTGRGPNDGDPTPLVSLFWSIRVDRIEVWKEAGLDAWKKEALGYVPEADRLLDQITDPDQMLHAVYHDVVMRRWHTHNVVYLGDAAHAMSPQLGQGANLALIDAMVLADSLAAHATLADGLAGYSASREDHLGFYQLATRWLTPFFQSDHAALGWLRDGVMAQMSRIPFFHREMVRSMAGVKRGLFGAAPVTSAPAATSTSGRTRPATPA